MSSLIILQYYKLRVIYYLLTVGRKRDLFSNKPIKAFLNYLRLRFSRFRNQRLGSIFGVSDISQGSGYDRLRGSVITGINININITRIGRIIA